MSDHPDMPDLDRTEDAPDVINVIRAIVQRGDYSPPSLMMDLHRGISLARDARDHVDVDRQTMLARWTGEAISLLTEGDAGVGSCARPRAGMLDLVVDMARPTEGPDGEVYPPILSRDELLWLADMPLEKVPQ